MEARRLVDPVHRQYVPDGGQRGGNVHDSPSAAK